MLLVEHSPIFRVYPVFLAVKVIINDNLARAFIFPPVSDLSVLVVIDVTAFVFVVFCCRRERDKGYCCNEYES